MSIKDQRFILAKKVVENMNKITEYWSILDRYRDHGVVPVKEPPVLKRSVRDLTTPEIISLCWTIHPYLSKQKSKLKKMDEGPKKEELKLKIVTKERELKELQEWRDE